MSELKCAICAAVFYANGDAWGDETCGDCIAAGIELALMPMSLQGQRKPLRRAPTPSEQQDQVAEPRQNTG